MNRTGFITAAMSLLVMVSSLSCKKESDETALPSLSGSLRFKNLPTYVNPQDEVTFTLDGITHPEGGSVRYSITVSEGYRTLRDTLEEGVMSLTYKFCDRKHFKEDTLRNVTVSASAFAEGYYSSSTGTKDIFVVRGGMTGGSINGLEVSADDEKFESDGVTYYARNIGGTTWLRRNVAVSGKGMPYMNEPAMLDVFGSYLNWEDAASACPAGYRLTTDEDWVKLAQSLGSADAEVHKPLTGIAPKLMADATFNYEKSTLWTYWKGMDIDNASGLSILPAGYANIEAEDFSEVKQKAAFWTADEYDAERAWCRYITEKSPDVKVEATDKKSFGASVRCVKE